ncbi:MAG: T9SS type A sorting domain-containing protein [Saprospiraceae bacterium]
MKNKLYLILLYSFFLIGPAITQSIPINYSDCLTGKITSPSQIIVYTLPNVEIGDSIIVRVSSLQISSISPCVKMYFPGNIIPDTRGCATNSQNKEIVYFATSKGTYTITVEDNVHFFTGEFKIYVERTSMPVGAINIKCGIPVVSKFDCHPEMLVWNFGAMPNSLIAINATGSPVSACIIVRDHLGKIVASDVGIHTNATLSFNTTSTYECYSVFVFDYNSHTTGNVTLTVASIIGGCTSVNIESNLNKSSFCTGENITLTAMIPTTIPNATYSWTGPKNFKSNKKTININNAMPGQSGTYTVIVDDPTNCSSSDSVSIVINNRPTIIPSVDPVKAMVCAGDSIKLNVNSNATIPIYIWTGPNEYLSSIQSPLILVPDTSKSGRWEYLVTVTDDSTHCSSTDTISVQINTKPSANITSPATGVICKGETLLLNVETNTSANSFSWIGPNLFTSIIQNPSITNVDNSNQGNYFVTVTDTNGCHRNDTVDVSIEEIVLQAIPINDGIIASASGGARPYTYTLFPGGQTDTTGVFTKLNPGIYTISVSDKFNCNDSITLNIVVGTVNPKTEWSLSISPNPSNGLFQILRKENNKKELHLTVFDAYGKMITSFIINNELKTLDLSNQSNGVYMIRISDGDKVGAMKVSIVK